MALRVRRTALVTVIAYLFSASILAVVPVVVTAAPAAAHGNCAGDANGPYKSGGQVHGKGAYICTDQHDRYTIKVCLDKWNGDRYVEKDCNFRDTGTHFDQAHVQTTPAYPCSRGSWQTRFVTARAFNDAGDLAHGPANSVTNAQYISSC
jgi:hypothetical protein